MKRFLAIFLTFILILPLVGCCLASRQADAAVSAPITLLLCGLDEAAENTDVLCLASADFEKGHIAVMQIPRDTYIREDGGRRINSVYASARYKGAGEKEALSSLSSLVSDTFGVSLDGAVAFRASALRAAVDSLGGVDVYFPSSVTVEGKEYAAGEHHLSGIEAEAFVRFREGYVTGDLGRVDAQKLFLSALLRRVREDMSVTALVRMLFSMQDGVITDLSLSRALALAAAVKRSLPSLSAVFFTLPGEAVEEAGHWYYIANRKGAIALLSEYFSGWRGFDPEKRLFNEAALAHTNIYYDNNHTYRVYTEESLSSIKIQTKKE